MNPSMEFDLENPLPPSNEKFPSLFQTENDHMPAKPYIQGLNSDGSILSIRGRIVSSITLLVRGFDPFSAYLAVNYLDRFLSVRYIREGDPRILKLVAVSCISLALKMRKTELSVCDVLSESGEYMLDLLKIQRMEMLILDALNWRLRCINPFSFINYFIPSFKLKDQQSIQALEKRATKIIFKAQNDIRLLEFKPSIISAAALLASASALFPAQLPSFMDAICSCSYVNRGDLVHCYDKMQDMEMELQSCSSPISISGKSQNRGDANDAVETRGRKRRKTGDSHDL